MLLRNIDLMKEQVNGAKCNVSEVSQNLFHLILSIGTKADHRRLPLTNAMLPWLRIISYPRILESIVF